MIMEELGFMPYRQAWARQEEVHEQVLAGAQERLLIVEHPPVITFGRRPGGEKNLLASNSQLSSLGVELVESDRGGDITFHGPGQIVAYPILRLADHGLSVSGYVHQLERILIRTLSRFEITAQTDPTAIGVWVEEGGQLAKIAAIGVRIRRGVTLHGLALNISTNLNYFNLIIPCGLVARPVTSIQRLKREDAPGMEVVRRALVEVIKEEFSKLRQASEQGVHP